MTRSPDRRRTLPGQQKVIDPDHRCNYSQVPHRLLDDIAASRLKATSAVLYLHYKRISWALHGEPVTESLRETQKGTGLSQGTILSARKELAAAGWAVVDEEPRVATVTLVERWAENCPGHDAQILSKRRNGTTPIAQKLSGDAQNLSEFAQKPGEFARNLSDAENETGPLKTSKDIEDIPEDRSGGAVAPPTTPKNQVTDEFIDELVTEFSPRVGGDDHVRLAIEKALIAPGYTKTAVANRPQYLRNWLEDDALKRLATASNGHSPAKRATVSTSSDIAKAFAHSKPSTPRVGQPIGRRA